MLKDNVMRWFMGLPPDSISTWDEMEKAFLEKYQEYCRVKDRKDEVFLPSQAALESLEYYLNIFLFG